MLLNTAAVLPPPSLPKNIQLARPTARRNARSVALSSIERSGFSIGRAKAHLPGLTGSPLRRGSARAQIQFRKCEADGQFEPDVLKLEWY